MADLSHGYIRVIERFPVRMIAATIGPLSLFLNCPINPDKNPRVHSAARAKLSQIAQS
jgi:hypothetical protein